MKRGSVRHLSEHVLDDLKDLCPDLYKSPREKLALMVGSVLEARSCNLMDMAAYLPLETGREKSRYAWIDRFLTAQTLSQEKVMRPLAEQILLFLSAHGETVVICLDQTCLNGTHAVAMVSVRSGNRALPLFWTVVQTEGNIATSAYLPLLEQVYESLPEGAPALLMADRFFDAGELIKACKDFKWGWRIRLRGNLTLLHQGGELQAAEMGHLRLANIQDAVLSGTKVSTHVGFLHEQGHKEPWIVAMDARPSRTRVLDYGLRWGIEAMFSDLKTRGFGLEDTHLQKPDKIDKLILVLAVALHWATMNGMALQSLEKKLRQRALLKN